jgi:hypothetical protein
MIASGRSMVDWPFEIIPRISAWHTHPAAVGDGSPFRRQPSDPLVGMVAYVSRAGT